MKLTSHLLVLLILVFSVACQKSSGGSHGAAPTQAPQVQEAPSLPTTQEDESAPKGSAEQVAIPVAEVATLDVNRLPAWPGTVDQLNQLVQESRNARLYPNPNPGSYLRRAPWYYGDGCYAKAAHVSALAESKGYPRAGKVLAFGGWATMRFRSKYLPGGAAWWNYHVVAAYHIGPQVYLIDPLVSPEHVLTVDEWIKTIAPRPEKISISFCDQNLYIPTDRCVGGKKNGAFTGHIEEMLGYEYNSLKSKGYDPDTVL